MDWYAEEILTIAWDSSKDTIPAEGKKPARCDNEWVNRSRLKVDTLKFLMAKLHPKRYGDKLPETVEQRTHEAALLELQANQPMKITWEREIISPIHDDDGNIVPANNNAALRARIKELEERLGIKDGKPLPPKLLSYDPDHCLRGQRVKSSTASPRPSRTTCPRQIRGRRKKSSAR